MVDLDEYKVDKGANGERLVHDHYVEMFDETVKFVKPNWGDKAEFSQDFGPGTPQADQVDPKNILKYFKKTFKDPDFSRTTAKELDNMDGDFVQKLLDIVGNLYNHPDNREMDLGLDLDNEADQKKSKNENADS